MTMVRNPSYFLPGLPYTDRVELVVDEDNASRVSAFLPEPPSAMSACAGPSRSPWTARA